MGVCPRMLPLSGLRATKRPSARGALLLGRFRHNEEWTGVRDDKTQGSGACHQQTWVWLPYLSQQEEPWAAKGLRRGSSLRKAGSGDNEFTVGGLSSQEMFPWHPPRSMATLCGRLWVQPLPCDRQWVGGSLALWPLVPCCGVAGSIWEPPYYPSSSADKGETVCVWGGLPGGILEARAEASSPPIFLSWRG